MKLLAYIAPEIGAEFFEMMRWGGSSFHMINSISFTAVAFIYHTTERHQDPSERSAKTQHGSWHLVQRPPHSIMGVAAKRPACVSHHPARRVGPRHAGNYLQGNARSFWSEKHSSFSFDARFLHSESLFTLQGIEYFSLKVTGVVNSDVPQNVPRRVLKI